MHTTIKHKIALHIDPTKFLLHLPAGAAHTTDMLMLHTALTAYLLAEQTERHTSTYLKERKDVSITK